MAPQNVNSAAEEAEGEGGELRQMETGRTGRESVVVGDEEKRKGESGLGSAGGGVR